MLHHGSHVEGVGDHVRVVNQFCEQVLCVMRHLAQVHDGLVFAGVLSELCAAFGVIPHNLESGS